MRNVEFQGKVVEASDLTRQFRIPHSTFRIGCGAVIDLSGKRAFVTGGGRGIGRATAVMLSRAGCRVAIGYRSRREDAEETVSAVERGTGRHRAAATRADTWAPAPAGRVVGQAVQAPRGL